MWARRRKRKPYFTCSYNERKVPFMKLYSKMKNINGGMMMKIYVGLELNVIILEPTDIVRTSFDDNFAQPGLDWGE